MANASWAAWKVNGTVNEPPDVLRFWLKTTCGEPSGAWSGMRSTVTWTRPFLASQGTDDNPPKATDAAPVKLLSSPMMATARPAALASTAEIPFAPTCPDVDTTP